MNIPFNIPFVSGDEVTYINEVIANKSFSYPGEFSKKCELELSKITGCETVRLTASCTSALELAALAIDVKEGDEVIVPSFTFVSSANAFALRGVKLVFVDIHPTTMCLDEALLEKAITSKTKAIVLVHYAGLSENIEKVIALCKKHAIYLIEDAAQSIDSYNNNQHLGTFGDLGCISFHDTKNIQCGEGGAILINNKSLLEKIDVIIEKGTDRKAFLEGKVNEYTWKTLGSSYGLGEINAAFLLAQLKVLKKVTKKRKSLYGLYQEALKPLKTSGLIDFLETENDHNAHIFFIKLKDKQQRNELERYLLNNGITAYTHYSPLHLSDKGKNYPYFCFEKDYSKIESDRLLRLPLFFDLELDKIKRCVALINQYFKK
ncbi:MAG: dTDP-4-amino-4,6-dideoxygalactose transaminase [Vicingaceae bacterium]|nr:dTDP-4-amino-4,6-dideoxygalactose transaminase [Vicingaceae bacterium]